VKKNFNHNVFPASELSALLRKAPTLTGAYNRYVSAGASPLPYGKFHPKGGTSDTPQTLCDIDLRRYKNGCRL